MRVIYFFIAMIAIGSVAFGAELDSFNGVDGSIDIAGGTAHIPVMKEAARRIMRTNKKIRITVAGGGSGVGVQKVGEGMVDIGNTGRALSEKEQREYNLRSFPFAIDGVAVIVNPGNPVKALTSEQVRDIFSGKICNWKDVGGDDARINMYGRDEASGTREVFWTKVLNKDKSAATTNVVSSNGSMKVAVSRDSNSIGYMSIGYVDDTVGSVVLDGIEPSQDNAITGKYPVVRMLYMNTKGDPSGIVKAFVDYITSADMEDAIVESAYIPVGRGA